MNSLIKKITAGIAALSMLTAAQFIMPASADDETPTPGEIQRTLSVEFLGMGAEPLAESPGDANFTDKNLTEENGKFWVGVAVDKIHDLDLFTNGIHTLEVAFEYDPKFVVPYYTEGAPAANRESDWNTDIAEHGNNDLWNNDTYEFISIMEDTVRTQIDDGTDIDREDIEAAKNVRHDNWKMCMVGITLKKADAAPEDLRFYGFDKPDKQYLIKLPFKLLSVPDKLAEDKNPTVLSLIRGPETLDIGAGLDGVSPFSAWEKTVVSSEDQENMKTLFKDGGDISLFGGTEIENIIPYKEKSGEEPEDIKYKLSRTDELGEEGFIKGTDTYYLSVGNEVEELKLRITSTGAMTVSKDEATIGVTAVSGEEKEYTTDKIKLEELKPGTDGFSNTVKIKSGDKEYTIKIRRLIKPKIVLRYGNSPVGQIMKDNKTYPTWAAKSKAIADFKSTRKFDGVQETGEALDYYAHAWLSEKIPDTLEKAEGEEETDADKAAREEAKIRSYYEYTDDNGNVIGERYYGTYYKYTDYVNGKPIEREATYYNGDDDPTSIFVYHRQNFQDVGFDAYDSLGERVDDDKVTSHLVMKTFYEVSDGNGGFPVFDESDPRVNVSGVDETHTGNMQYFTQPETKDVCPDVYEMTYSFEDPYVKNEDGTQKKVTQTRKVIAISKNGDVYLNEMNTINPQDVSAIEEHFTFFGQNKEKYSVYVFRVADVWVNDMLTINPQDASEIGENLGKPVNIFYNTLPTTTQSIKTPFITKSIYNNV